MSFNKNSLFVQVCFSKQFENEIEITFANRKADRLGDPCVDERITLRWIFSKGDVGVWTGSSWFRIGTVVGHL
jgi:hypothetical protein